MIEQILAGVVGGMCGVWVNSVFSNTVNAYAIANDVKVNKAFGQYVIAAITGAYLFIQWFC